MTDTKSRQTRYYRVTRLHICLSSLNLRHISNGKSIFVCVSPNTADFGWLCFFQTTEKSVYICLYSCLSCLIKKAFSSVYSDFKAQASKFKRVKSSEAYQRHFCWIWKTTWLPLERKCYLMKLQKEILLLAWLLTINKEHEGRWRPWDTLLRSGKQCPLLENSGLVNVNEICFISNKFSVVIQVRQSHHSVFQIRRNQSQYTELWKILLNA